MHVALAGPNSLNVMVPAGAGAGAPAAVKVAVSVMGLPTGAVAVAVVEMAGWALLTVVNEVPVPLPTVPSGWEPMAAPSWAVWMPRPIWASLVGAFRTLKVKSILQVSVPPGLPGGASMIGVAGVKLYLSWIGSMLAMTKFTPAHAVPTSPTPMVLSRNTPGSAFATGQLEPTMKAPHVGTKVMTARVTLPTFSGGVELLVMLSETGRPVWPTVTSAGKVGTTPKPTPADAGGTATSDGVRMPSVTTKARTDHHKRECRFMTKPSTRWARTRP